LAADVPVPAVSGQGSEKSGLASCRAVAAGACHGFSRTATTARTSPQSTRRSQRQPDEAKNGDGILPVVVCRPPRSGAEIVAVGKGAARSPRVAGPSIPSPDGATETHQNRSRPYRACHMWWPHTQGCASLALGWRMLAFQAAEEAATTAKNAGNSASPKATRAGMPAIHEGKMPRYARQRPIPVLTALPAPAHARPQQRNAEERHPPERARSAA
jgi:hypothetical protein